MSCWRPSRACSSQRTCTSSPLGRRNIDCVPPRTEARSEKLRCKISSTLPSPTCSPSGAKPKSLEAAALRQTTRPCISTPIRHAMGVSSMVGDIWKRTIRCSLDCDTSNRFSMEDAYRPTTEIASKLKAIPSLDMSSTPARLPWMSRIGAAAQCIKFTLSEKCSAPWTDACLPVRTTIPGAVVPTASSAKLTPMRCATGVIFSCKRRELVAPMSTPLGSVSMAPQFVAPSTASISLASANQASRNKRFFCKANCARLAVTG